MYKERQTESSNIKFAYTSCKGTHEERYYVYNGKQI